MRKLALFSALSLFVVINQACNKDDDDDNPTTTLTLYDSLGGTQMVQDPSDATKMIEKGRLGIRSVVDSTIFVIAADPQLNSFFPVLLSEVTSGNMSGFMALEKNLTDFFSMATGAKNFTYTGKNMIDAHDPSKNPRMSAKASNANFDRFIEDLVVGAQKNNLPSYLITRVGQVTETTRSQVVQN